MLQGFPADVRRQYDDALLGSRLPWKKWVIGKNMYA